MAPKTKGSATEVAPRRVAVSLIVRSGSIHDQPSFLMVSSRKHDGKFVLPKGGIEEGEDAATAGLREAWEEAGLILGSALHLDHLATLQDDKAHEKSPSTDPADASFVSCTSYSFELFSLPASNCQLADEWPEKDERTGRKWVTGWDELEAAVDWGRRAGVMIQAVRLAKSRLSG